MTHENKHKHLDFIQGAINRLSRNSFSLKGWVVVLSSAFFALSAQSDNSSFILLALIPILVFWGLDGFFLWQEQLFRKLYDRVRVLDDDKIDFSMNTIPVETDVSPPRWMKATFSKTLIPFYGACILAVAIVWLSMVC